MPHGQIHLEKIKLSDGVCYGCEPIVIYFCKYSRIVKFAFVFGVRTDCYSFYRLKR